MFEKGQGIVHPMYGGGVIIDIQAVQVGEIASQYYRIDLINGGILMVPTELVEEAGLRPVMDSEAIFDVLSAEPIELASNYRSRQARIKKKIKSGDPIQIAEALRDLAWRARAKKLSSRDMKLRFKARQLLCSELAVHFDANMHEAADQIDCVLAQCIESHSLPQ